MITFGHDFEVLYLEYGINTEELLRWKSGILLRNNLWTQRLNTDIILMNAEFLFTFPCNYNEVFNRKNHIDRKPVLASFFLLSHLSIVCFEKRPFKSFFKISSKVWPVLESFLEVSCYFPSTSSAIALVIGADFCIHYGLQPGLQNVYQILLRLSLTYCEVIQLSASPESSL